MKKRKYPNKHKSGQGVLVSLAVAVLLAGIFAVRSQDSSVARPAFEAQAAVSLPKYSPEEMQKFWYEYGHGVWTSVVEGRYFLPEIQSHYQVLLDAIIRRYGQAYRFDLSIVYADASPLVICGNEVKDGPVVRCFVPTLMNIHANLRRSGRASFRQEFENGLVGGLLHEMAHLAFDPSQATNRQVFLESEDQAWADTSEHVLAVFAARGQPLDPSHASYYGDWTRCGRARNACWREAILTAYAQVLPPK